jgi:hypothetical protein
MYYFIFNSLLTDWLNNSTNEKPCQVNGSSASHFMKLEGSVPLSQQPASCLYPEPDLFSSQPATDFFNIHSNIILPSTPRSSTYFPL